MDSLRCRGRDRPLPGLVDAPPLRSVNPHGPSHHPSRAFRYRLLRLLIIYHQTLPAFRGPEKLIAVDQCGDFCGMLFHKGEQSCLSGELIFSRRPCCFSSGQLGQDWSPLNPALQSVAFKASAQSGLCSTSSSIRSWRDSDQDYPQSRS